jgi:CRISPR-associated protein Csb2
MGLDAAAQRAVAQIRRTWTKGRDKDILVTCVGMGELDLFRRKLLSRAGQPLAVLGKAKVWSSFTPFVPPRHVKKSRHRVEDQVRTELSSRGLPPPVAVEFLDREEMVRRRLLRFVRTRRPGKPQPPRPAAFGLRLIFDQAVNGPVALGYAAHYGLGLMASETGP